MREAQSVRNVALQSQRGPAGLGAAVPDQRSTVTLSMVTFITYEASANFRFNIFITLHSGELNVIELTLAGGASMYHS